MVITQKSGFTQLPASPLEVSKTKPCAQVPFKPTSCCSFFQLNTSSQKREGTGFSPCSLTSHLSPLQHHPYSGIGVDQEDAAAQEEVEADRTEGLAFHQLQASAAGFIPKTPTLWTKHGLPSPVGSKSRSAKERKKTISACPGERNAHRKKTQHVAKAPRSLIRPSAKQMFTRRSLLTGHIPSQIRQVHKCMFNIRRGCQKTSS